MFSVTVSHYLRLEWKTCMYFFLFKLRCDVPVIQLQFFGVFYLLIDCKKCIINKQISLSLFSKNIAIQVFQKQSPSFLKNLYVQGTDYRATCSKSHSLMLKNIATCNIFLTMKKSSKCYGDLFSSSIHKIVKEPISFMHRYFDG